LRSKSGITATDGSFLCGHPAPIDSRDRFIWNKLVRSSFALTASGVIGTAQRSSTGKEVMMKEQGRSETTGAARRHPRTGVDFVPSFHGVRYQSEDVERSVAFYTQDLHFKLEHQQLPDFAVVSLGALKILLSGPGASGSRPMPSGQRQQPGGWNRVVLRVDDLASLSEALEKSGLHFRNKMEVGPAGKQIQLEDPDGNPIELFEPAHSKH
jgi:glyoxylase I family protein